jgi:hypothetical protein
MLTREARSIRKVCTTEANRCGVIQNSAAVGGEFRRRHQCRKKRVNIDRVPDPAVLRKDVLDQVRTHAPGKLINSVVVRPEDSFQVVDSRCVDA